MTLHDAAKQALDVLQGIINLEDGPYDPFVTRDVAYQHFKAIQDLRDALAEQDEVAAEREACARMCELLRPSRREYDHRYYDACTESARAIRARGLNAN